MMFWVSAGFWPRGLVEKAAMVLAGLICYDVEVVRSFVVGDKSLKRINKYWV